MHDLSASAKFHDAHFQSPLLIISRIVTEIHFVYQKMEKYSKRILFFSIQTTIGSFGGDTLEIKQDWLLCL